MTHNTKIICYQDQSSKFFIESNLKSMVFPKISVATNSYVSILVKLMVDLAL